MGLCILTRMAAVGMLVKDSPPPSRQTSAHTWDRIFCRPPSAGDIERAHVPRQRVSCDRTQPLPFCIKPGQPRLFRFVSLPLSPQEIFCGLTLSGDQRLGKRK